MYFILTVAIVIFCLLAYALSEPRNNAVTSSKPQASDTDKLNTHHKSNSKSIDSMI